MKTKLIFLALCLVFFSLSGQKIGYKIMVDTKDLTGECVYLCLYEGNYKNTFVIDSMKITRDKQTAVFGKNQKIVPAFYQIRLRNKNIKRDVFVDNGSFVSLKLSKKSLDDLTAEDSFNRDFLASQNNMNPTERAEYFTVMEKKFPYNSLFKLFTLIEKRKLDHNFAAKFTDDTRRQEYLKDIDLNDKRIRLMPNIYQFLNTYTSLFPIDKENYKKSVDVLLKGQNCDSRNYLFYLDWVFKNLEFYNNKKDFLEMYKYVFDTYLNDTKCLAKDQKLYSKTLNRIRNTEALPIGGIAPDFKLKTIDKKETNLKDIYSEKQLTVIIFYDPDCVHCQSDLPKMTSVVDGLGGNHADKINKIAFFNATDNEVKWKNFIKDKKLENWCNVEAKDKSEMVKLGFATNPSYLIINRKGEVLAKRILEKEILNFLQNEDKK